MPPKNTIKGGNPQMYNIQGLILPGGYTHTVAANEIRPPIFAGLSKTGGAKKKTQIKKAKKINTYFE